MQNAPPSFSFYRITTVSTDTQCERPWFSAPYVSFKRDVYFVLDGENRLPLSPGPENGSPYTCYYLRSFLKIVLIIVIIPSLGMRR
jgi:hypothetical protein